MQEGQSDKNGVRDKRRPEKGYTIRVSRQVGLAIFTPLGVNMDDFARGQLWHYLRMTRRFFGGGSSYGEEDSMTNPFRAHLITAKVWTGVSVLMFIGRPDSSGDLVRRVV